MTFLRTAAFVLTLAAASLAHAGQGSVTVTFSNREIDIITAYYRETSTAPAAGHGHGHAQGKLPRGIAKNLERGKPLPPGIAKQALPPDLAARLPPPPQGFERLVVAGKVLLVEVATQAIHDVLTDVVFRH